VSLADRKDGNELGESRKQIHEPEAGHRATHEVVGNEGVQSRPRVHEVVLVPERRPGHDNEQQPDFEKKGDEEQAADQMLPPGLDFREPIDAGRHIAVTARVGLQFHADDQRAGDFAG
jgi:hypothetical protein